MDWLLAIRESIDYIEENLHNNITLKDVSEKVFISPFFFEKGFSVMTGYSVSEYIRNRRLYISAVKIRNTNYSILNIALESGFKNAGSFTKAFKRFHCNTPSKVRKGASFKTFLPINVVVTLQGGDQLNYSIKKTLGFKFIGLQREFTSENANIIIPKFWDWFYDKYAKNIYKGGKPENDYEEAISRYNVGEYAICIDDIGGDKYRYVIAGRYTGGEIPKGMFLYEQPMSEWAVFDCIGPLPETLQVLYKRIIEEWLPSNDKYELSNGISVARYDGIGDFKNKDYHSELWIPIVKNRAMNKILLNN